MNSWVSGLTKIFDSVATNFSNVWTAVHAPSGVPVQAAPAPSQALPQVAGVSLQTILLLVALGVLAYILVTRIKG